MRTVLPLSLFAVAGAATILAVGLAWHSLDPVQRQQRETAARIALIERQAEIERTQRLAAQVEPVDTAMAVFWRVLPAVVALGALGWMFDSYRLRRRLVAADSAERLPVARTVLEHDPNPALASIAAFHTTQLAAAQRVALPDKLTYSPHVAAAQPQPSAPAVLQAPEPEPLTLPTTVELSDAWNSIKPGHVAFGAVAGGELLQLPLARIYHALFHGDTGGGKTNAIDSMIVQLHRMAERSVSLQLYAGDYKRELATTWRRSSLFAEGIQTEPKDIANMLADLAEETRLRQAAFERAGTATGRIIRNYSEYVNATGDRLPVVVCIVDELNAVLEASAGTELDSNLRTLLQMGRASAVLVHGGFQYMTSNVFGRDGSKQFITRAHFGAYDQTAVKMLFGAVDHKALQPLVTGQAGRGLIRTVGQAQPSVFQALHCSEQDILEAIQAVEPVTKNTRIVELVNGDNSAYETPEPQFMNAAKLPDYSMIVQRLRDQGKGKNAIIEVVWGAKPGGTQAYRTASAEYDRIVKNMDAA